MTTSLRPILIIFFFATGFAFTGCSLENRISKSVDRVFEQSEKIKHHHVGFALYNPSTGHMVYEKDAEKYYTPASNTKLFTFYAGLKMLPDSIPSLRYIEVGDSLIFWGTGDPSFLQTKLKGANALSFLKRSSKKLYFSPGRYTGDFYGRGWQWDDYNDYYQAEINELPIMDNLLNITSKEGKLSLTPRTFSDCIFVDTINTNPESFKVVREFGANYFRVPNLPLPSGFTQQVPYKVSTALTLNLLSDTLKKPIALASRSMPANAKTIYGAKRDSVLKEMMLPSDNFIAEQLILVYANQLGQELNAAKTIDHIEKTYLKELPDKIEWADGSGLSRYNLFTPRDIVVLLDLIYKEVKDTTRLFNMLPAGGMTGTLKNAYPKTDRPFVFGKTGSLSNIHNQSGYVVTKKGKLFIFSFMNNNFVLPTSEIRKEMVRVITHVHDNF